MPRESLQSNRSVYVCEISSLGATTLWNDLTTKVRALVERTYYLAHKIDNWWHKRNLPPVILMANYLNGDLAPR